MEVLPTEGSPTTQNFMMMSCSIFTDYYNTTPHYLPNAQHKQLKASKIPFLKQGFRLQSNRMQAEGKFRPGEIEEGEREKRLIVLGRELDYMLPLRHRFFNKQYAIGAENSQLPLLLRDMEDYHRLLASQSKKVLDYLHDYQLQASLNALLAALLRCHQDFAEQGARLVTRISKRESRNETKEAKGEQRCSECSRVLNEYRVQQLREELKLDRFEDPFKFFNVDHLNFGELERLQRASKALFEGELQQDNPYEFQGACISLEQYDEVLNLLGSDIHQKNNSIQKIIDYLSKTDKRLLGEEKEGERMVGEDELSRFDAMVAGDTIKFRLRDIMRLFLHKYHHYKVLKRKDAESQVNIKENDVIRQLEQEKKQLRGRICGIITDRERMARDYESRLREAQLQIEAVEAQLAEQTAKSVEEAQRLEQRLAEERHLHDLHKDQLERLTNEYVGLQALFNRSAVNKETRSNSKSSNRQSVRKSKKEKQKYSQKRQRNSIDSNEDVDSNKNLRRSKGRQASNSKLGGQQEERGKGRKRRDSTSMRDINRMVSYQKIDEKTDEEESDGVLRKKLKRKTSRFKAMINHFGSNSAINQQGKPSTIPSLSALLQSMEPHAEPSSVKLSEDSRSEMLLRLFQSQKSNHQLSLPFTNFLQQYNSFISSISAQKQLVRSSSLKPRPSRAAINDTALPSRTAKSIEESVEKHKQQGTKKGKKVKDSKLEPIQKHSQFYLKKVPKMKQKFQFKNYSRTAQNTLRNNLTEQKTSIKDVQDTAVESIHCLAEEDLDDLFLGRENIIKFDEQHGKADNEPFSPIQNQILMKMYALMATLHIKCPKYYHDLKSTLADPKQVLGGHPTNRKDTSQLKAVMKRVVKLHRKCRKEKGTNECPHIQRLISKISHLQASSETSSKETEVQASLQDKITL